MNDKNVLTFVNHACFYVANAATLLLVDPWVEGPVFNHGWSLLDSSTSNAGLVKEIAAQRRITYIWFSHEHPDHFSVPFIKRLKQDFPGPVTLLYQKTKDQRVVRFLRQMGFSVVECHPGRPVALDPAMSIVVHPYADGDSWCLIRCGERTILNLNDCAVASAEACRRLRASLPADTPIDVLLTQFGYANWVGNPFDADARRAAAAEKLQRIKLQMAAFAPRITIPFASFVTFASVENYYLNDCQNSAASVARWAAQGQRTDAIRFMQPGSQIDLDRDTPASLRGLSEAAVAHWTRLGSQVHELLPAERPASHEQVQAAVQHHRRMLRAKLLFLPWLLERLGLIHPLVIYVPDLTMRIRVSYVAPYRELDAEGPHDVSMTSPSVVFLFRNEYGFNTTHVNGRFRTSDEGALRRFSRFFMPQNLWRQGYGIDHPAATLGYLLTNVAARLLSAQRRTALQRIK